MVNERYFNQISVNLSIKMHMLMFLNFLKKKIANFFKLYKCIAQSINILDCYYEKNFKKILICLRFVDISTINLDNLKVYLNLDPSLIVI
ncbi:hypothetical protein E5P55_01090 [Candidatus Pinguicoccus supinus]|uniref:Uncharacterized protein n=1 Tax=Candidatus Pinguicoccus supinus TaxID=2529394 RepID=A0A7T0BRR8_9BACT|nr:hypothetical protein E5P55_01090 [Candidatus Pinguicoccus supinus]